LKVAIPSTKLSHRIAQDSQKVAMESPSSLSQFPAAVAPADCHFHKSKLSSWDDISLPSPDDWKIISFTFLASEAEDGRTGRSNGALPECEILEIQLPFYTTGSQTQTFGSGV